MILNFLAWGYSLLGWTARTITTYHSQLVAMYPDKTVFATDPNFSKFFRVFLANQVAKTINLELDLHPILQYFCKLPSNEDMPVATLHKKLCWMLATCTFLCPSDIARIDLSQTKIVGAHGAVHLVVVQPKETRGGVHKDKIVILQVHPREPALCPVATYHAYVQMCVHSIQLEILHKTLPTLVYNLLMHALNDPHTASTSDMISNSISDAMK
ncbi:hypothetical protein BG005_001836 [Podila minutissima]|nr:hypothetical protein BG005_001836 [Podila minutissima]